MGRKPKHDSAMSDAEKMREYRQRKQMQGKRDITLTFTEEAIIKLDEVVETYSVENRSVAVAQLLQPVLDNAVISMQGLKDAPEYNDLMQLEGEQAEFWLNVRRAAWVAICSQDKADRDRLTQLLTKMKDEE